MEKYCKIPLKAEADNKCSLPDCYLILAVLPAQLEKKKKIEM